MRSRSLVSAAVLAGSESDRAAVQLTGQFNNLFNFIKLSSGRLKLFSKSSYALIDQMKLISFGTYDVLYPAALTILPLLPLFLFNFSLGGLPDKLLEILI